MKYTFRIILCILVLSAGLVSAQEIEFEQVEGGFKPSVEQFTNGYIDWGNGYYYTVSKGFPPKKKSRLKRRRVNQALQIEKAKVAAIEGAKAQILLMANRIRVDAEATVGDLVAAGYKVKIEGDIKEYEIVKEGWIEAANCYEVVVRASLSAVSGQLIDSQITKVKTGKRPEIKAPEPEPEPHPEPEPVKEEEVKDPKKEKIKEIKKKAKDAENEMLLIIDARGTGANQAMFPEVKDGDGADIFNITLPDKVALKRKQMAKYIEGGPENEKLLNNLMKKKNILYVRAILPVEVIVYDDAPHIIYAQDDGKKAPKKKKRRRRFTTRATKSSGKLKANIVISKEDAKKIIAQNKESKFFEKANVYVIMDPSIGGTEGFHLMKLKEFLASI